MEFFKSGLKSVLGTSNLENQPTGAETVERLIDRVASSTLLNDRRDACRALKALSRTYRVEVGAHGMEALKQILDMDKTNYEIVGLALEILYNITSPDTFGQEGKEPELKHNIGEQFTEILIKKEGYVALILKFLEEFDFRVRWPALRLLRNLLTNKLKKMQEIILISPMGVSKLMDMLSDSREVIRNDALLVLIQLTKGNTNIQKIVAFENAFDRIYEVVLEEGGMEGGIVVEDCLLLMINLLKNNYSNQNFFKEGNYIQKLTSMFKFSFNNNDDSFFEWSPQKLSNVHCIIQVVRVLVAPNGPVLLVNTCQNIMKKCGLLQALCNILMISGVPADLLTETINAVAEVIRSNASNQDLLDHVMAPSNPPRSAIIILLMSMVNEKQPFPLRCAVLYCFQCFLYKNNSQQVQLLQTLLPQGNETLLTTGQLLCGGLFSPDPLSNWLSAIALSYTVMDSSNNKEQLLRVLLATNIGTPPITLMEQCVILLHQNSNIQSKLGLLTLLCTWTSYCSLAVKFFLSINSSVPYLIGLLSSNENNEDMQEMMLRSLCSFLIGICVKYNDDTVIHYSKENLCRLIENRIGLENFQESITNITKHELYSRSLKLPQPSAKNNSELLLDHEFCKLLKTLEVDILKSVINSKSQTEGRKDEPPSDSILVIQYKELIRKQDFEIEKLNKSICDIIEEKRELECHIQNLRYEITSLLDQNKILRTANVNSNDKLTIGDSIITEESINDFKSKINNLEDSLSQSYILISNLQSQSTKDELEKQKKSYDEKCEELIQLQNDQEDLLELLAYQDKKLKKYEKKLLDLGEKVDLDGSSDETP
ncbi:general vesicular transport factor p115 isoform X2 [Phymastichus coffea]|uniref:general vesicular transport factor p115 isoform X2 n=1 Tax=Phymastichus coffea TaxID=108790 RepID=UPI00273C0F79|nr:general vesicular transport factor p115 isoform X2 [Phymastichus coffea]XP_058810574.1 general vesicular transport factor p115 isoform X2 [Phymastichus coffea]XP_058810575.1 general vesicular transport factor p115 isoform X2 [Phymastichus coffea]XP_058810576.1 general vesicular transport factor p115 isoform X2 [Phymastichus coffea]XP_058810577.1 general vesicular transport factor p115 isoform X2 [Phymastichus coffea]